MDKDGSILAKVSSPQDLKGLTEAERISLAQEIREHIIETVSRTGGHLASNLGVIELTLALHTVFDSPKDKLVWDVGHQCYAHKLLTGRQDEFASLRHAEGASGFTRREESVHDAFGAGHASTSISAALGLAKARDARGGDDHVVAIIGDGAMTGGLALEGMNNAEQLKTNVIVVLNDNRMSISENVGAMALHLSKLRMKPIYQKVESHAKAVMKKMPAGRTISRTAEGLYHGVTHLWGSQTGIVFEELGFTYLGPIDGHNSELVIDVLEHAKLMAGPVLVHVVTQKGKGYEHAEHNASVFHGIAGFHVADGVIEPSTGNTSYTSAFGDALIELAEEDERIVAITAAMRDGTGLAGFAEAFPDRFYDVGIAEQHAVTFAAGLAAGGLRPVVAMYSTFLQRAYDQVVHDVCLQGLPVIFAIDRAGLVGEDGPTHHGVFDMSFLRHVPGLVIACPKDTMELRDLLATALTHDGPMAIRYPRGSGPVAHQPKAFRKIGMGCGELIVAGEDAAVIAVGDTVYAAIAAAQMLASEGVSVEVVNARFVKPLDEELITGVLRRGLPVIVAEENSVIGGFGSAVVELASSRGIPADKVRRLGIPDAFAQHGSTEQLREQFGLSASGIADELRALLSRGGRMPMAAVTRRK